LINRDLCTTSPFDQFLRQDQILILEISNIFLWLKFLPSLNLNKIEHSAKVSNKQTSIAEISFHVNQKYQEHKN